MPEYARQLVGKGSVRCPHQAFGYRLRFRPAWQVAVLETPEIDKKHLKLWHKGC